MCLPLKIVTVLTILFPPTIQEGRCYSKDLGRIKGLSDEIETVTFSGEYLKVKCVQGFSLGRHKPLCLKGEWLESNPPCIENGCLITAIPRGQFEKSVISSNYWGKEWIEYHKVPTGRMIAPNAELHVFCNKGYTFQGKGSDDVPVKCNQGKWKPTPVCLVNGEPYQEEEITTTRPLESEVIEQIVGDSNHSVSSTSRRESAKFEDKVNKPLNHSENDCKCTYRNFDAKLIAYVGNELLRNGMQVMNNSKVRFHCLNFGFYRLQGPVEIICKDCRGWHSSEYPVCVYHLKGRCYSKDLKNTKGMSDEIETVTLSGESLKVKCVEGFSLGRQKPLCLKGEWTEYNPPCIENGCLIEVIPHGQFTRSVIASSFWSEWTEYHKVSIGRRIEHDSRQFVSCNNGYTFQGKGSNDVAVKCNQGKWKPKPVCLVNGEPYQEEEITTTRPFESKVQEHTVGDSNHSVSSTSIHESAKPEVKMNKPLNHGENDCKCTYQNFDTRLIAYVGKELLRNGIQVKNNSTVRFHCKNFGFYHLQGPEEMICKDCRDWHSSEYPVCVYHLKGEATIFIQGTWKHLAEGVIEIEMEETIRLFCDSNGADKFPKWRIADYPNVRIRDIALMSIVTISYANASNNGTYECGVENHRPKVLNIQFREPAIKCQKFNEGNDFNIIYDNGQEVNSSVIFSCKYPKKKIVGTSTLTCLSNGQWSGAEPECKSRCYSKDLKKIKGISDEIEIVTFSGESLEVKCVQGFSLGRHKPLCLNGEWLESNPPCIENGCLITAIQHGQFTRSVIATNYWGQEWIEYHKVPTGRMIGPNAELHVSCNKRYTFQANGSNDVPVKCNQGKWKPTPVCLVNGEFYQEEEITTTRPFRRKVEEKEQKVHDASHSVSTTSIRELTEPESQVDKSLNHRENFCTCTYRNFDPNLIAHAGNELLRNGIQVKNNSTVRFQCKNSGIYRLRGSEEIICKNCQTWHSSEYPDCVNRTKEPAIKCQKFKEGTDFNIIYDNGQEVNSSVTFSCKYANKQIVGTSILTCLSNGQWSGAQPKCKTQCPKLTESEGLSITYTKGLDVFSRASFHCFSPRIHVGVSFAGCKYDGRWSDSVPTCLLPSCSLSDFFDFAPENVLPDMTRVNNDTLPYNFTLHLTCENNMMLIGSNTARCGSGGAWEVHKVECVPGCAPLTSDKSTLIVEPEKEFYRFGDSVTFSCPEDQELDSEVVRVMCLLNGWSEEKLPSCQDQVKEEIESIDPIEE